MKRLIVFIFIVILLCLTNLTITKDLTFDKIFANSKVEIFFDRKTDLEYQKIQNGVGEIVFCEANQLSDILKNDNKVSGFTIKIKNENVDEVLKKLNVKNVYDKNFGIYGWSNLLGEVVNLKLDMFGSYVNFQCVNNEDGIILGCPIILGSY